EMIKPAYQAPIDQPTLEATLQLFEQLMQTLHPFMPFITEEIYQHIAPRQAGESIMTSTLRLDEPSERDLGLIAQVEQAKQVISGVRAVRQSKSISPHEPLRLEVVVASPEERRVTRCPALGPVIEKLACLGEIAYVPQKGEGSQAFLVGTDEYAVPLGSLIDREAERRKALAEIERLQGFMAGIRKKLGNERFVENAPKQVVELERKKLADAESKIAVLRETVSSLAR
ncbi:MAG: class I tRNA ligase family protein, partial [Prevotellaceae bacterium]|nr:class I tRNA ligase family protein [Prevotellaceae bacterium]